MGEIKGRASSRSPAENAGRWAQRGLWGCGCRQPAQAWGQAPGHHSTGVLLSHPRPPCAGSQFHLECFINQILVWLLRGLMFWQAAAGTESRALGTCNLPPAPRLPSTPHSCPVSHCPHRLHMRTLNPGLSHQGRMKSWPWACRLLSLKPDVQGVVAGFLVLVLLGNERPFLAYTILVPYSKNLFLSQC